MDTLHPETSKKTILVVSPWKSRWSLGEGAGVSDDHHFIEKLTRAGFELHFLAPRGGTPAPAVDGLRMHAYPDFFDATRRWPTALKRLLWPLLFNTIVTVRAVRTGRRVSARFVLGHSHYGAFPSFIAGRMLKVPYGVKLFGVMDLVHTEWPKWKYWFKNFEQICALKVPQDVWIILDDGTRGGEAASRLGVSADKIRFLPNGINLEWIGRDFDRNSARRRFHIDPNAIVVLFLARLVASKRPEHFVRAVPRVLAASARPVCFLIVGDGDQRHRCETLARSLGVEDAVRFAGTIPHDDVPAAMSASDVFVSTSRLTNAAIPTCEAMVCGLPVVAFDVGDTTRVVRDGETGRVVADGDTAALADAVAELINDDATRRAMAKRAQAFAAQHFTSWDDRVAMELEIINALIERAPKRQP